VVWGSPSWNTVAVDYLTEKWGGKAHRRGFVQYLGEDQWGSWLWGEAGRHLQIGGTRSLVTEHDDVILIPRQAWWACQWWLGHPEVELYVDIATPAQWLDDRVSNIDLDLDVVRFLDGRVEILDRDEFEAHRRDYEYPSVVVEAAKRAADEISAQLSQNVPPFDGSAAREWVKSVRDIRISD
jgi:protein associated with RNAse G/E